MNRTKGSWRSGSTILKAAAFATAAGLLATPVLAVHSWNNYHWKRTTTQISPPVGDNVTTAWDSYLSTAVSDWNRSSYIQSSLTAGQTTRSTCGPKAGRIEVCNYAYGATGWLGIAQIWLAADGHISQGTSKMNDTYYATAQYNTPAWRAAVMCQEIGHDYGLGHQDEDFNTDATNSCMEYTNVPAGNEHPDTHDYNQLASIYSHVHSASNLPTSSAATPPALAIGNTLKDWGRVIGTDKQGHHNKFERDLGNGVKVITHVTWLPDMHVGHNH
ncbi:MAG TPA: hypothetical protein VE891_01510 [Allosphingosinicella sp.]|nr:hypothetical protein [Allosphingosinicella sp.]